jgi:hypothetical protein
MQFDRKFFEDKLAEGKVAEACWYKTCTNCSVVSKIMETVWWQQPWDFNMIVNGKPKTAEIKLAAGGPEGGWDKFCAETYTIGAGKIADWRAHHKDIDWYVVYSEREKAFHVYDCSVLAHYVKENKPSQRLNKEGTAYYVWFKKGDKKAGYLTTIPYKTSNEQ